MDKFETVWKKIDAVLFQLLRHICALILGALVAVVFFIFFGRYVMHHSPMWGEPFSLLCLVWLSLLGSVLVVRKNEHLAVTMFDEKLGEKGVFLTDILASVCVFAFSIFLIVYGIKLAQQGAGNNMAGINVPYSFMYSALPVTGVLNIFAVLGHWVERRKSKCLLQRSQPSCCWACSWCWFSSVCPWYMPLVWLLCWISSIWASTPCRWL